MCTGRVTRLLCGHSLVYFGARCPARCAAPEGEVTELRDTCAACHPPHRIRRITIEYDLRRERLMAGLRRAEAAGDAARARDLGWRMRASEARRREELRRANIRGVEEEVQWPGKLEP